MKNPYQKLEDKIKKSYEEGVTLEEAERLAAEFLHAQIKMSDRLKVLDLDCRMKKSGVKTIKSAVRLDIIRREEKKPTESTIDAMVDTDKLVTDEQQAFDIAEVDKEDAERYFGIFKEAHIYYRGIAKGRFD